MAQRHSGRDRIERDRYDTPDWVIDQIAPHIPSRTRRIWEPAAGRGQVGLQLMMRGFGVAMSDIEPRSQAVIRQDFLEVEDVSDLGFVFDGIFTNPPFGKLGPSFVEHALRLTEPHQGWVMMLFGSEWDTASKRPHLLDRCPQYVGKFIHQERIVWFNREEEGQKKSPSPSSNHAWYLWDWRTRQGWEPRTRWLPKREKKVVEKQG